MHPHQEVDSGRGGDNGDLRLGGMSSIRIKCGYVICGMMQALMATKARWLLGQLQLLGFPDWQCAVAVLRYGSDLHGAIAFLLEEHVTSEEQSRAYMASAVESPDIDITEELQILAEAQVCIHAEMTLSKVFGSPCNDYRQQSL